MVETQCFCINISMAVALDLFGIFNFILLIFLTLTENMRQQLPAYLLIIFWKAYLYLLNCTHIPNVQFIFGFRYLFARRSIKIVQSTYNAYSLEGESQT